MAVTYSVIIPTLNEEKFLPKLLTTLAQQTLRDFEVIIVDGASEDKTREIAQTYADILPKLTVISVDLPNVSKQRNAGAQAATGSWFIFIDADSIIMPYTLDRIDAYIRENKPTFLTTWFRSDTEKPSDALVALLGDMFFEAALLLHRPAAQGPLLVVAKHAFGSIGGFDERHLFGEDYDLTRRLTKKGNKLHIIRETLYVYSLRRLRYQNSMKAIQTFTRAIFSVLLTNNTPRSVPGYIMGGAPYSMKKESKKSTMRKFTKKFRTFMRDVFD